MKNTIYKIKKIKNNKVLIHHHLGLGDTIICNGLVNYLSNEKGIECFLPVKRHYLKMVTYLYKDNQRVNLFGIDNETRDNDVESFAEKNDLQILKIGFEKVKKDNFNTFFYKQLKIPYEYSFKYFNLPEDSEKYTQLQNHLLDYFDIKSNDFILVHNESSYEKYELKIESKLDQIVINKESDLFNNLFLYKDLIRKAKEIHCINGSFLHLVERVDTNAQMFYHHLRKNNIEIQNSWEWVLYD
jgi:hypothetical protein